MKKVCICGHFGGNRDFFDGQTVKTKNLYNALIDKNIKIIKIDTFNPKKRLLQIIFQAIIASFTCKNIIILPAHNGIKIFVPLFVTLKKLFNFNIHYAVVGGWLPELLKENERLKGYIKKIDYIYVETSAMIKALEDIDVLNTVIMPNFKYITAIPEEKMIVNHSEPFRLCIFSRIMREKGVTEAINIISSINKELGRTIYALDIYGPIENDYIEEFNGLIGASEDYIKYKGIIKSEQSVEVIKDYFLLLFPTKFATEGHPGTILDAYNAGVPVLASQWNSCFDIINDKTGLTFEFNNFDKMKELLIKVSENPEIVEAMRVNCLKKADDLRPEKLVKILTQRLGE